MRVYYYIPYFTGVISSILIMEDPDILKEATKVVTEIQPLVSDANISPVLQSGPTRAYINLKTKEDIVLCIQLTAAEGYKVCPQTMTQFFPGVLGLFNWSKSTVIVDFVLFGKIF